MARVVLNHSTHVPGLVAALSRVPKDACSTLVPGRLFTGRGNTERLSIHVSVATPTGWRLLARKGSQVQEIFAVTALAREPLQDVLTHAASGR